MCSSDLESNHWRTRGYAGGLAAGLDDHDQPLNHHQAEEQQDCRKGNLQHLQGKVKVFAMACQQPGRKESGNRQYRKDGQQPDQEQLCPAR